MTDERRSCRRKSYRPGDPGSASKNGQGYTRHRKVQRAVTGQATAAQQALAVTDDEACLREQITKLAAHAGAAAGAATIQQLREQVRMTSLSVAQDKVVEWTGQLDTVRDELQTARATAEDQLQEAAAKLSEINELLATQSVLLLR